MNNNEFNNYESNSSNYKNRKNYSDNFVGQDKNDITMQKVSPPINEKQTKTSKKL